MLKVTWYKTGDENGWAFSTKSGDQGPRSSGRLCRAAEYLDFGVDIITHLEEGRMEMFYLTTHSTHFIYSYVASDIW